MRFICSGSKKFALCHQIRDPTYTCRIIKVVTSIFFRNWPHMFTQTVDPWPQNRWEFWSLNPFLFFPDLMKNCWSRSRALWSQIPGLWSLIPALLISYTCLVRLFHLLFTVLGLACFSVRTKGLVALTSVHGLVGLVSLFYFVAVRQLNKPTPEKPNKKLSNSDDNHINWHMHMDLNLHPLVRGTQLQLPTCIVWSGEFREKSKFAKKRNILRWISRLN